MTRLEALKALADEVKKGDWDFSHNAPARIVFPYQRASADDLGLTALSAFDGSLDAAKGLHEAVLPGWHARLDIGRLYRARVISPENAKIDAYADNAARAWLLAILRALIAQEESK